MADEIRKVRFPLALKIGAATFGVMALSLEAVLAYQLRDGKREVEQVMGRQLLGIAATAALDIDGDLHDAVESPLEPGYDKLQSKLLRVVAVNSLPDYSLFTLAPLDDGSGYEFVVNCRSKPMLGWAYVPPPELAPFIEAVLTRGVAVASPEYKDAFGTYVSALAPIRNRAGKVVGILEIDHDLDEVMAQLQHRFAKAAVVEALGLTLALIASLLMSRQVTRSVSSLVAGIRRVNQGDYQTAVAVRSRDEIGVLADAFNGMLIALRERLSMLRFIPRHTQRLISQAAREHAAGGELFEAHKRDLAVLFSDIRGFTTLSDRLPPDRVIAMLNIYLRQETEIVERHGGSIDKFIGDAVMALFEGPDRFARAADTALEIQEAMRRLNESKAFEQPIEVGIGIAGGEVVMGSVGSDDRTELAVIGRLVNLASRLTSAAGRGEVMISDQAFEAIGEGYEVEKREGLHLKGFADDQTAYRLIQRRGPEVAATRESPG